MTIEYLGHSCFCLIAEDGTRVITDPYTKVGYELPTGLCADIVTVSHGHFDHNCIDAVRADKIIDKTGVYSYKNVKIRGVTSWHDSKQGMLRGENIIFTVEMDGLTICHLGDLGEPFSEKMLKKIGKPDILLLPVGGTYTINAQQAKQYAEKISPKVLIPMHYRPQDGALDIAEPEEFLSLFTEKNFDKVLNGELIISEKDFANSIKIIYMERKKNG